MIGLLIIAEVKANVKTVACYRENWRDPENYFGLKAFSGLESFKKLIREKERVGWVVVAVGVQWKHMQRAQLAVFFSFSFLFLKAIPPKSLKAGKTKKKNTVTTASKIKEENLPLFLFLLFITFFSFWRERLWLCRCLVLTGWSLEDPLNFNNVRRSTYEETIWGLPDYDLCPFPFSPLPPVSVPIVLHCHFFRFLPVCLSWSQCPILPLPHHPNPKAYAKTEYSRVNLY